MNSPDLNGHVARPSKRLYILYFVIVAFAMLPIWTVKYYVSQDGVSHIYNAFLMNELVDGNQAFTSWLTFNSFAVPNSTGHWLLALLLRFLPPFTALKVIASVTFAAFIASVGWLRSRSLRDDACAELVALLAPSLAFCWMWFEGFYNFIIGTVGLVCCLALFQSRRDRLHVKHTLLISVVLTIVYLSHIVPFVVAASSLIFLAAFLKGGKSRLRNISLMVLASLPAVALALWYRVSVGVTEPFWPAWHDLGDGSIFSVLNHIRTVDPFFLMSRTTLPFSSTRSAWFVVLTPSIWIAIAMMILVWRSFRSVLVARSFDRSEFAFLILLVGWTLFAIAGPDDFGSTNGGILRERILLCGSIFAIPLVRAPSGRAARLFVSIVLIAVVVFQTTALWDYSVTESSVTSDVLAARNAISDQDSIMTIAVVADGMRFHSVPEPALGALLGFGRATRFWDNYELAFTLFPVTTRDPEDRSFFYRVWRARAFRPNDPKIPFEETYVRLTALMKDDHSRFTKIVLLGSDSRIESLLANWFDPEPVFAGRDVRVFRHRD